MAALTKNDLRDYVMAGQRNVGKGYVLLDLKHNLTARNFTELQFHTDMSVEEVKDRVYSHTGSRPEFMTLILNNEFLDDSKTLGAYGPKDHDVLHVVDNDPNSYAANGGLDNVNLVKKFELTDEEYDKRPNTYRKWKQEQLKKDPNWKPPWLSMNKKPAAEKKAGDDVPIESLESVLSRIKVGDRCECAPGRSRGTVKYVGYVGDAPAAAAASASAPAPAPAPAAAAAAPAVASSSSSTDSSAVSSSSSSSSSCCESKNCESSSAACSAAAAAAAAPARQVWIGVLLDEPRGKNNGTAKGKEYFKAGKNYGLFLKPHNVKVGDFPERDILDDSDEEEAADKKDKAAAATAGASAAADGKAAVDVMEEF